MKKLGLSGLVLVAVASVAATAWAFIDVNNITIAKLELQRTSGTSSAGYRIFPTAPVAFTGANNPASCAGGTTFAEVHPSATPAERVAMNNTLLAAFLSGRKVSLRIAGATCGSTNFPAYEAVRLLP